MFLTISLSIIMFFFCLYFYFEQKKLKQRIIELELETKTILERKLVSNKEDIISIENLSTTPHEKEQPKTPKKQELKNKHHHTSEEKKSNTIKPEKYKAKPIYSYEIQDNYKINNSKLINKKQEFKDNNKTLTISNEFNPSDFINNKQNHPIPKKNIKNTSIDYLTKLSKQLEEEQNSKTIELTDYEKAQEEQAIISYQELLSLKNELNIKDDEYLFNEDLKNFNPDY